MGGITIVKEHLCRELELSGLIIIGIIFTLMCLGALWAYIHIYKTCDHQASRGLAITCSIIVVVLCLMCWFFQISAYNKTHVEYTVIVDDCVGFNDFYEKYEILSANGDEYRVIEK